jgi:transposase
VEYLAELARAGERKPIWIPQPEDEAIRNLARAREDAVNARTQARQQLKAFLLRAAIAPTAARKPGPRAMRDGWQHCRLPLQAIKSPLPNTAKPLAMPTRACSG